MKSLRDRDITRRASLIAGAATLLIARPALADLGPLRDSNNYRGYPRARPSEVTDRDQGRDPANNGRGSWERQLIGVNDRDGVDPAGSGRGPERGRNSGFTDKDETFDRPGNGRGYFERRHRITD